MNYKSAYFELKMSLKWSKIRKSGKISSRRKISSLKLRLGNSISIIIGHLVLEVPEEGLILGSADEG